jgi:biotin operon repressor
MQYRAGPKAAIGAGSSILREANMTDLERRHWENRVLAAIMCRTIGGPVTGDALAQQFGTNIRTIAGLVERWRDAGIKIGSRKGGRDASGKETPMGYFLASNAEEMQETILHMEGMARQIFGRAQKLKRWNDREPSIFEQTTTLEEQLERSTDVQQTI